MYFQAQDGEAIGFILKSSKFKRKENEIQEKKKMKFKRKENDSINIWTYFSNVFFLDNNNSSRLSISFVCIDTRV